MPSFVVLALGTIATLIAVALLLSRLLTAAVRSFLVHQVVGKGIHVAVPSAGQERGDGSIVKAGSITALVESVDLDKVSITTAVLECFTAGRLANLVSIDVHGLNASLKVFLAPEEGEGFARDHDNMQSWSVAQLARALQAHFAEFLLELSEHDGARSKGRASSTVAHWVARVLLAHMWVVPSVNVRHGQVSIAVAQEVPAKGGYQKHMSELSTAKISLQGFDLGLRVSASVASQTDNEVCLHIDLFRASPCKVALQINPRDSNAGGSPFFTADIARSSCELDVAFLQRPSLAVCVRGVRMHVGDISSKVEIDVLAHSLPREIPAFQGVSSQEEMDRSKVFGGSFPPEDPFEQPSTLASSNGTAAHFQKAVAAWQRRNGPINVSVGFSPIGLEMGVGLQDRVCVTLKACQVAADVPILPPKSHLRSRGNSRHDFRNIICTFNIEATGADVQLLVQNNDNGMVLASVDKVDLTGSIHQDSWQGSGARKQERKQTRVLGQDAISLHASVNISRIYVGARSCIGRWATGTARVVRTAGAAYAHSRTHAVRFAHSIVENIRASASPYEITFPRLDNVIVAVNVHKVVLEVNTAIDSVVLHGESGKLKGSMHLERNGDNGHFACVVSAEAVAAAGEANALFLALPIAAHTPVVLPIHAGDDETQNLGCVLVAKRLGFRSSSMQGRDPIHVSGEGLRIEWTDSICSAVVRAARTFAHDFTIASVAATDGVQPTTASMEKEDPILASSVFPAPSLEAVLGWFLGEVREHHAFEGFSSIACIDVSDVCIFFPHAFAIKCSDAEQGFNAISYQSVKSVRLTSIKVRIGSKESEWGMLLERVRLYNYELDTDRISFAIPNIQKTREVKVGAFIYESFCMDGRDGRRIMERDLLCSGSQFLTCEKFAIMENLIEGPGKQVTLMDIYADGIDCRWDVGVQIGVMDAVAKVVNVVWDTLYHFADCGVAAYHSYVPGDQAIQYSGAENTVLEELPGVNAHIDSLAALSALLESPFASGLNENGTYVGVAASGDHTRHRFCATNVVVAGQIGNRDDNAIEWRVQVGSFGGEDLPEAWAFSQVSLSIGNSVVVAVDDFTGEYTERFISLHE